MSRLLKNPSFDAGALTALSIGSGANGPPLKINGSVQFGSISNITVDTPVPNSIVYTDSSGTLQFGDFTSINAFPAFAASNLLLGDAVNDTGGSVVLTGATSVTSAIVQLNQQIAGRLPIFQRFEFNTSTQWLVQHGMNTTRFFEVLTDSEGNRFNASINIIDANSFRVTMTAATAGFVDVNFIVG